MNKEKKHIPLESLDRTLPFKAPEGYFDTLSDKVMSRIDEETSITTSTKILRIMKPALAIAASFAIIFTLIFVPIKTIHPKFANQKFQTEQEFLDYYYYNDHIIVNTFEAESQEEENFDDDVYETMLLASVSDLELLNF